MYKLHKRPDKSQKDRKPARLLAFTIYGSIFLSDWLILVVVSKILSDWVAIMQHMFIKVTFGGMVQVDIEFFM